MSPRCRFRTCGGADGAGDFDISIPVAIGGAAGDGGKTIVAADSLAGKYVWTGGGSGADWKDGGKWSKDGVAGDWHDSTTAVFANAGDAATIAAGETVTVASLEFRASATVGGKGTLNAVLPVVVSDGADAAVNAPMASALVGELRFEMTTCADCRKIE